MSAGGRALADYKEAERQYVIERKSIRAICRDMGLKSWSGMAVVARREDWDGKRIAYEQSIARRSYEVSAATVANQNKEIRDEAMMAGRVTLRAYLSQFDPKSGKAPPISPRDAQIWAAFLLSETQSETGPSTEVPDVRNVTPPDAELLRRVVEVARERVAPARGVGPAALVESSESRPN